MTENIITDHEGYTPNIEGLIDELRGNPQYMKTCEEALAIRLAQVRLIQQDTLRMVLDKYGTSMSEKAIYELSDMCDHCNVEYHRLMSSE